MTRIEFGHNLRGAETICGLTDEPRSQAYWIGYMRGLRRHYHGSGFGTMAEHEAWLALAADWRSRHDSERRFRGAGYRIGLAGTLIGPAMMDLAKRLRQSDIGSAPRPSGRKHKVSG